MSFTFGGTGDILPPRPKQSGSTPGSQPLVQESVPRDVSPQTTPDVDSGGMPVTIPQGRSTTVLRLVGRKPTTKKEAIQSAIAQSTGNVIPLPNIKDITDALKAGVMRPNGTWRAPVGPGGPRGGVNMNAPPTQRRGLTKAGLCTAVGIIEAQRHGNSITLSGNKGQMRVLSGAELIASAQSSAAIVAAAIVAGSITQQDIADCQAEYCKRAQCPANHSAGAATMPTPPDSTTTTSSTGTAASTSTIEIPDSMLPPSLPQALGADVTSTPALPDAGVSVLPFVKAPETGVSPAVKGFLWVFGGVAAYLLFKKLSGVKVVGAAMAGVPLIADLGDGDDAEDEEQDAGHGDAHETDSETPEE